MDKDLLDLANSRIDAVQSLASWILPATAILAALFICVCLALLLAATRGLERLTELAAEQAPDPTDPLAGMRLAEAVAKEDLLGPALKEGVAGYRTWHLAGHAPPSGLFGGRIRRQLAKFESMARYIGASLTILGLLFTFIGMQYVVENVRGLVSTDPAALSEEEDSDSFERSAEDITRSVLSNVAGSLGGMDLAFRSSIHGIIYGLLVLLALHVFRIYRDSRLAKLNDLVVMRIAPVFVPTEPDRQADHFIEHTQQLVANAFSQVEDNSTRVMDKLEAQNREFVEKLVASIQGLVKESIEDLRRTSDEGIAALRGGSEEFVKKLAETSEAQSAQVLKRHAVTEQALLQATDQSLTKVSKSLQELSSAMIQTQATSTQEVARDPPTSQSGCFVSDRRHRSQRLRCGQSFVEGYRRLRYGVDARRVRRATGEAQVPDRGRRWHERRAVVVPESSHRSHCSDRPPPGQSSRDPGENGRDDRC